MIITDVKIRPLKSTQRPYLVAVASITIDNALIINDIYVYRKYQNKNKYNIVFPSTQSARQHGECSIVPTQAIRQDIEKLITDKINSHK